MKRFRPRSLNGKIPQGNALRRLLVRSGYGSGPEEEHRIPDLATQGTDQFPHFGPGIKTVILYFHQPQIPAFRMIQQKIHFLASPAEILRLPGIIIRTFNAAHHVAFIDPETVDALHVISF